MKGETLAEGEIGELHCIHTLPAWPVACMGMFKLALTMS